MENLINLYLPIEKTDADKKMVYGYASTEALDSQGEVVKREALEAALPDYMKFGNVREMHQPSAVGKAKEATLDAKGLYIGVKVVDPAAWEKVKEGVYSGFSIGGRVVSKVDDEIRELSLSEISLVDRPANPEAVFDVFKAEGMAKEDEPEKTEEKTEAKEEPKVEEKAEETTEVKEEVTDAPVAEEKPAEAVTEAPVAEEKTEEVKEEVKTEVTEAEAPKEEATEEKAEEVKEVSDSETPMQKVAAKLEKFEMPSDDEIVAMLKAEDVEIQAGSVDAMRYELAGQIITKVEESRKSTEEKDALVNKAEAITKELEAEVKKDKNVWDEALKLIEKMEAETKEVEKAVEADGSYVPDDFATAYGRSEALEELPEMLDTLFYTLQEILYCGKDAATKAKLLQISLDQFVTAVTDEEKMYLSETPTSLKKAGRTISSATQSKIDEALAALNDAVSRLQALSPEKSNGDEGVAVGAELTPSEEEKLRNGVSAGSTVFGGGHMTAAERTTDLNKETPTTDLSKLEGSSEEQLAKVLGDATLAKALIKLVNEPAPVKAKASYAVVEKSFEGEGTDPKAELEVALRKVDEYQAKLASNPNDPALIREANEFSAKVMRLQREAGGRRG